MKKIIIGLTVAIVAVLVLVFAIPMLQGDGSEKPWGATTVDGTWKTELWIVFDDGNEVLADNLAEDTFSVAFTEPGDTQKVTGLRYKVSAKASTDGGYTTAYLDLSDVKYGRNIMLLDTATTIYDSPVTPTPSLGTISIPVDDQWHEILDYTHILSFSGIQDAVEANPYVGYSFGCYIDGVIKFRGDTSDAWTTIDSPALASITLIAISSEIYLDLSGEITVIYT